MLPHLETGQPFTWSSEPHEGLAICKAKAVPSFLSYFKSLSLNPAEGIQRAIPRAAIKRSNPVSVEKNSE